MCAMLGQPTPTDVDWDGSFYTLENGVEKSGGGKGSPTCGAWTGLKNRVC